MRRRGAALALALLLGAAGGLAPIPARAESAEARRLFDEILREARVGMDRLVRQHPGRADLESVRRQVGQVEEWTRGGRRPSAWQVRSLSFGLIAAREIEPLDLPLARRLESLATYLRALARAEQRGAAP